MTGKPECLLVLRSCDLEPSRLLAEAARASAGCVRLVIVVPEGSFTKCIDALRDTVGTLIHTSISVWEGRPPRPLNEYARVEVYPG